MENPRRELKLVQARIARLLMRIAPPDYLFCPVKGRCYVKNAAHHRGNRVIKSLDVHKYFPNTSSKRIFWFFRTIMKCANDVAWALTQIASYKQHLPTGSPLSPILAYFAHYDVWEQVASICAAHGYRLSVYIDDVTVSGSSVSEKAMWEIKKAIYRAGLRYHKEKRYYGRPAEITGVIVNGERLLPPNRQLKKLHLTSTTIERLALPDKALLERQRGLQGQMAQIAAS